MDTLKNAKNAQRLGEMVVELNDIIEQTFYLEQKVYEWNQKVEGNKKRILKSLGKRSRLDVKVDEDLSFIVSKSVQPLIEFYKDQLSQNLDKPLYKKAVKKTHVVNDINGLIKMLKEYEVNPKEFKKFISTEEQVNKEAIEEMIEMGDLQIEDLHGCYKAEFNESIHIKRIKNK